MSSNITARSQIASDFKVSVEQGINSLGYALLSAKKTDEALAAFRRNVELYPHSANVYNSLADGFEAAGKPDLAVQNVEKAVEVGTQTGDPLLPEFSKHLERLVAAGKFAPGKAKQIPSGSASRGVGMTTIK